MAKARTGQDQLTHSLTDRGSLTFGTSAVASAKAALPRPRWPPELVPVAVAAAPSAWRRWTGPVSAAASAWASGPTQSSFRAGIPSALTMALTASGKTDALPAKTPSCRCDSADTNHGALHFLLLISGWKTKYVTTENIAKEQRVRRCPLCRGTIPPSRDQISSIKMTQLVMKKMEKSDPVYEHCAREVKQFEAEYGEDWEVTAIEYDDDCVGLPL
ncbi:hypothetical protein THAOC_04378 [Thalassiosira oceanica]|uniref:RING-type domain-containing protein n=1 Tax=Thalassiosira oceanica TaxID=159749 RepID=K0TJ88_THAOC|nr:hypothetical protein THAOC_04378 [Thalassiosira oceanica]|eukprot:EJK73976.1 hypothetical protein THAOC_04378 [Thalassiosira oceanica]